MGGIFSCKILCIKSLLNQVVSNSHEIIIITSSPLDYQHPSKGNGHKTVAYNLQMNFYNKRHQRHQILYCMLVFAALVVKGSFLQMIVKIPFISSEIQTVKT